MPVHTLKREERLKSRKVIAQLFKEGRSFGQYPLRLVWLFMAERQSEHPAQFALTVPKKRFRKATDRNRLRRLIREAYRLNKHRLYRGLAGQEKQLAFMIIYTGKEEVSSQQVGGAMRQIISRFLRSQKKVGRETNPTGNK